MNKKRYLIILFFFAFNSFGNTSFSKASQFRGQIIDLVDSGYFFSAIPYMKEYISLKAKVDRELEKRLEMIISKSGVKPFEVLPESILENINSGSIKYILSKKYAKKKQFDKAVQLLKSINSNHPIYPFVQNLLGSVYSLMGNEKLAIQAFKDCAYIKGDSQDLRVNRDLCLAGIARSNYALKKYDQSNLEYLDIQKNSYIWPSILFEEAWNSYYLGNYNRTLGKLVTYKAPLLNYIFNPEIEVLKSLSYLKLCLYDDAEKISNDFYSKYMEETRSLRLFLLANKKNYKYFYRIYIEFLKTKKASSKLLSDILNNISKDYALKDIQNTLVAAGKELKNLKLDRTLKNKKNVEILLRDFIESQRTLLGGYVRKELIAKYTELHSSFEGMSYIRLEVLSEKKKKLYSPELNNHGKRGDERYLDRNDKQYFWNFNGEFWADELGDYVFALKSEC